MNIPTTISGPYSYDGAPIELFFAALKKGNINPLDIPVSKSKYIILYLIPVEFLPNLVKLIDEKISSMNRAHIIMYFHHAVYE